jgi:hypothetical protein
MKAGESQVSPARFTTAPAGHVSPVPQQIAFSFYICLETVFCQVSWLAYIINTHRHTSNSVRVQSPHKCSTSKEVKKQSLHDSVYSKENRREEVLLLWRMLSF